MSKELIQKCINDSFALAQVAYGDGNGDLSAVGTVVALHDAMMMAYDRLSEEETAKIPGALRFGIANIRRYSELEPFELKSPILTDEKRQEVIKSMQEHYRNAPAAASQVLADGMHFLPPAAAPAKK